MINNKLTKKEFENLITPIISLDEIENIKSSIYSILHFTKQTPREECNWKISADSTGYNSTYLGFSITVFRIDGRSSKIIQFKKRKTFFDYLFFSNPNVKVINKLKELCEREIHEAGFAQFYPDGRPEENIEIKILHQAGTKNPEHKKENNISPLVIYSREDFKTCLVEFIFTSHCYERKSNKTILRSDWLNILSNYTPSW